MADPKDDPKPGNPHAPAPPATPGDVKRNPIKHPQIIALEKKVSEQEDTISSLTGKLDDVLKSLEDLNIGASSGQTPPSKKRIPVEFERNKFKKADPNPAPETANDNDVDSFLWGKA